MKNGPLTEPADSLRGSLAGVSRFGSGALHVARRWSTRGAWALLDQGLFACANFVTYVLLARWLGEAQYGGFTVAFSAFLLLGTVHTALFTEPMLIFGPGRFAERFGEYLALLVRSHWVFGLAVAIPLAIGGLVAIAAGSSDTGRPILALAPAAPCILFLWLMRRACYARLQPRLAAIAGMGYVVTMLSALYGLKLAGTLTAVTALLLIAVVSLGTAALLRLRLGREPRDTGQPPIDREVRREHLRYGRWAVGTSVLTWVPGNVFFFILPIWWGLEGTAALRAMYNLLLPVLHGIGALSILLLPALVRIRGSADFRRSMLGIGSGFVACAVLYWLGLIVYGDVAAHWLYQGRYDGFVEVLLVLGILPISTGLVAVLGGALRAIERPDLVFWAYLASSLVGVLIGIPVIARFGVLGGAIAQVLASAITVIGLVRATLVVRRSA